MNGRAIMDYVVRDGLAIFFLYNCTLKNRLKRSKTLIEHNVLTCSILSSFQCDISFFLTMKLKKMVVHFVAMQYFLVR